jgi:hypothetical protein
VRRTGLPDELHDAALEAALAYLPEDHDHLPAVLRLWPEEAPNDGPAQVWGAEVETTCEIDGRDAAS